MDANEFVLVNTSSNVVSCMIGDIGRYDYWVPMVLMLWVNIYIDGFLSDGRLVPTELGRCSFFE